MYKFLSYLDRVAIMITFAICYTLGTMYKIVNTILSLVIEIICLVIFIIILCLIMICNVIGALL